MIHHGPCSGITRDMADGETVLNHVLPCFEVPEHNLMSAGHGNLQRHTLNHLACRQVLQRHGHIIVRIYFYILHKKQILRFAQNDRGWI